MTMKNITLISEIRKEDLKRYQKRHFKCAEQLCLWTRTPQHKYNTKFTNIGCTINTLPFNTLHTMHIRRAN